MGSKHFRFCCYHTAQSQFLQQLPEEHSFANFDGDSPMISYIPLVENINSQSSSNLAYNVPVAPVYNQNTAEDSYTRAHLLSSIPQESSVKSAGYPYALPQTSIHKHVYVHVPPKDFEDEAIQPRVHHQVGPKQNHYKIVFIKAPSAPMLRPPVVAPPPQNEEKTLIYVLHKKPEDAQDIVIPTPAPTKPSKPEVFFIKYKTKKEVVPVYGPPPSLTPSYIDIEPRHSAPSMKYSAPSMEYGAPNTAVAAAPEFEKYQADNNAELSVPLTTLVPALEDQHPQQFTNGIPPSETDSAPTVATFTSEPQPTTAAAPTNQYLAPQPLVASEE